MGISSEGVHISLCIHGVTRALHLQRLCGGVCPVKALEFPFIFLVLQKHLVSSGYVGISSDGCSFFFYIYGVAQTLHLQWVWWVYLVKALALCFIFLVLHEHLSSVVMWLGTRISNGDWHFL